MKKAKSWEGSKADKKSDKGGKGEKSLSDKMYDAAAKKGGKMGKKGK